MVVAAGGYRTVDPLYLTERGISVASLPSLVIFCGVLLLISGFSLLTGRRGFCHYACWMAPFLILGRKARNAVASLALQLESDREACVACGLCTQGCPMSLDVRGMVQRDEMENAECVLCASCADVCPKGAIRLTWGHTGSPSRPAARTAGPSSDTPASRRFGHRGPRPG